MIQRRCKLDSTICRFVETFKVALVDKNWFRVSTKSILLTRWSRFRKRTSISFPPKLFGKIIRQIVCTNKTEKCRHKLLTSKNSYFEFLVSNDVKLIFSTLKMNCDSSYVTFHLNWIRKFRRLHAEVVSNLRPDLWEGRQMVTGLWEWFEVEVWSSPTLRGRFLEVFYGGCSSWNLFWNSFSKFSRNKFQIKLSTIDV